MPLPQVGDVAVSGEDEKVGRLVRMLSKELSKRKGELSRLGTDYRGLRESGGSGMPAMLFVVDGMASFLELYEPLERDLVTLLREGPRVGMWTLLCANAVADVRLRMRQSIKLRVVLELADEGDYLGIFSHMRGTRVPHGEGSGLVEVGDERLVFQGAFIVGEGAYEADAIDRAAEEGAAGAAVQRVRLMPDHVRRDDVAPYASPGSLVVGLYEGDLSPVRLDTSESPVLRVLYSAAAAGRFAVGSLLVAAEAQGVRVSLADCAHVLDELPGASGRSTLDAGTAAGWLAEGAGDGFEVLVVTGVSSALASPDGPEARERLRGMRRKSSRLVVLVDSVADASWSREAWYAAHAGQADGLWVGPGADSQTAIRVSYGAGDKMVAGDARDQGYVVVAGCPRRVRLVGAE